MSTNDGQSGKHLRRDQDRKNDPRPTEELIQIALADDEDAAWDAIWTLQLQATPKVLAAAQELCKSDEPAKRMVGIWVLGQLGIPKRAFPNESLDALLERLKMETEPEMLTEIATALGHLNDPRAVGLLVELVEHPSEDVRHGVAFGLLTQEDDAAVAALIRLSSDPYSHVRDWATFGLGRQIDLDTPEIREALAARLDDPHVETRSEGILGLARRKDERVIAPLIAAFEELAEDSDDMLYEAATELGDKRLCPALLKIWSLGVESHYLKDALESCSCVE